MIHLLHRLGHGTASRVRNIVYRCLGVDVRRYCWLRAIEIPRYWSDITLHGCSLDRGVVLLCSGNPLHGKIEIGEGTYINRYTILDAHERISVGRDVMIGPHCFITDGEHGIAPGSSVKSQPMTSSPIVIEEEAWLGAHVSVLSGVRIGRGAVVGAGAVVTKNVNDYEIVAGVPARLLRVRQ